MCVTFLFLILICFLFYRFNLYNGDSICKLNVSLDPSPPLNPLMRSELKPLVENLHIELASTLKIFLISIVLGLLILSILVKSLYSCRFISLNTCTNTFTSAPKRLSSAYRTLHLLLLIISFLIIFDFYFIILLPREFFKVQLLTKSRMKQACRIVKIFQCCLCNISLYAYKKIACMILVSLVYLNFYPCEVFALWYFLMRLILSPDIHPNPGPIHRGPQFQNNYFNFMSWNLNSITKDNFQRVSLIEAHNSLFNYDLISICETSLNDSVELPEPLLNEYTFVPANNPANKRHGGVGLFYKNSLPVVVRNDLSFDESIVVELKFGRKKYSLLFCIEVLLLITTLPIFKPFCQILEIYMPKSKQRILLQYFLPETLMLTPSFGGLIEHAGFRKLNSANLVCACATFSHTLFTKSDNVEIFAPKEINLFGTSLHISNQMID